MLFRIRAPLSLVAAIVAIALVAAVLVGGRLIQDWNTSHRASPAGSGINQESIAQLEARPLEIPVLKSTDACPAEGPFDSQGRYGLGPVFGIGGFPVSNSWGTYWHVAFVVGPSVHGSVLIRGRDLRTQQPVFFEGANAYGPADPANPQMHSEMLINVDSAGRGNYAVVTGLAKGYSACNELQIDGAGFSEHIVGATDAPQ